jgi:hypothetical protein
VEEEAATLADLREVIGALSTEDRKKAVSVLAEYPDCGLVSYDLKAELAAFEKADGDGQRQTQDLESESPMLLFNLRLMKNLASIEVANKEVLRIVFLQDDFSKGWGAHLERLCGEQQTACWREFLNARLPPERAELLQTQIADQAAEITRLMFEAKAAAVSEAISAHLHRMARDFFLPLLETGVKASALEDHNVASDQLARPDQKWNAKKLKKMITEPTWRQAKPFLTLKDGRPRVSNEELLERLRSGAVSLLDSGVSLSVPKLAGQLHIDLRWLWTLLKRNGGWKKLKTDIIAEWNKNNATPNGEN